MLRNFPCTLKAGIFSLKSVFEFFITLERSKINLKAF
jgi:hypothetical protein